MLLGKRTDRLVGAWIIDADGHDLEALWAIVLVQSLDRWHLDDARLAPRGPHAEQHDRAPVVGHAALLGRSLIDSRGLELRGFGADGHEEHLVADESDRDEQDSA